MLQLNSTPFSKIRTDMIIFPVCEDRSIHNGKPVVALEKTATSYAEFSGKPEESLLLRDLPGIASKRIRFSGLGKIKNLSPESFRKMAGRAVQKATAMGLSNILFILPTVGKAALTRQVAANALAEGALLGNHQFDKYKKKEHPPITNIHLSVSTIEKKRFQAGIDRMDIVCRATLRAREWVSTASNDKRPEAFAEEIRALAEKQKLSVRVLDDKALKKQNFGALLSVARGSSAKPRLVILKHNYHVTAKTVVLVGKGVTFDTGGINLKAAGSIENMKLDMSGAAAVAAILLAAREVKLKVNLIGILPLVENMPSGTATRPGDIIKTLSGKTVEIGNTDAEGRLILADAVTYAIKEFKPDTLIDLATLTGACVIALGDKIAGVFSPDDTLADRMINAGKVTHERCWRMPLPDDYKKLLKSEFADINNISSSRWGGAITAALFLKEFVGDVPGWAHIDIAGPSYQKKATDYCGAGGTGFGVRLLFEYFAMM